MTKDTFLLIVDSVIRLLKGVLCIENIAIQI